ncbi:MAG: UDP-N-acetylglucosamine 1-carboxyvinyltransferase [Oligoflexales bacterium]
MSSFIIEGGYPLEGHVTPSGNKNEALPTLMASLLTNEPVTLRNVPRIRDVLTVCQILEDVGASVEWIEEETLRIDASKTHSWRPNTDLCSRARASILLLGPLLARFGKVELAPPGGDVIGARRLDTHFEGVAVMGGSYHFGNPITSEMPNEAKDTELYLDEPSVTATENLVMLASARKATTTILNAACEPHVVGLCKMLIKMGADIQGVGTNQLKITGNTELKGCDHKVGPDFMEIGSFLCLGAITKGTISIGPVEIEDLRFSLKTLARIGIHPHYDPKTKNLTIGEQDMVMQADLDGRIGSLYSGPWPAFPSDLMSVTLVAATRAEGAMIFHEKMYEGRMFFTDKLMAMGANIVLCDPHRVVVTGPRELCGAHMSSPDVRAGMSMLMAALIARGTSRIDNIHQIDRGYTNIEEKLTRLGAQIKRVQVND